MSLEERNFIDDNCDDLNACTIVSDGLLDFFVQKKLLHSDDREIIVQIRIHTLANLGINMYNSHEILTIMTFGFVTEQ